MGPGSGPSKGGIFSAWRTRRWYEPGLAAASPPLPVGLHHRVQGLERVSCHLRLSWREPLGFPFYGINWASSWHLPTMTRYFGGRLPRTSMPQSFRFSAKCFYNSISAKVQTVSLLASWPGFNSTPTGTS